MNVALGIAGLCCLALALGHATIGLRWILPNLGKGGLASTPFGPPSMTAGMLSFTWLIVTVVLLAFTGILMSLALVADANPKTVLLRWFTAFWLVATATALWNVRRRPSALMHFPVPLLFPVIAVMCWIAST